MKLFFLFLIFSFSIATHGKEIYKWTDANGKTHFSDKEPGNITAEKKLNITDPTEKEARPEENIRKSIAKSTGKMYAIYNKAQKSNPSISGKLAVKLEIAGNGKVVQSSIVKSELQDDKLEHNLITELEKIDFGKGNYRNTSFIHTFDFLQKNAANKKILTTGATRTKPDQQIKPKIESR